MNNPASAIYDEIISRGYHAPCSLVSWVLITNHNIEKAKEVMAKYAGYVGAGNRFWNKAHPKCGWEGILEAYEKHGFSLKRYIPRAKTVRTLERELKNVEGTFLVSVSRGGHSLVIRNGEVLDWTQNRLHRIHKVWRVSK